MRREFVPAHGRLDSRTICRRVVFEFCIRLPRRVTEPVDSAACHPAPRSRGLMLPILISPTRHQRSPTFTFGSVDSQGTQMLYPKHHFGRLLAFTFLITSRAKCW